MRITWYGHSCFLIETGTETLLIDPFLTGNPRAPLSAADVRCTHIFCTHAHDDHLGDTLRIALANKATVFAPYELAEYLMARDVTTMDLMPGGGAATSFGHVQLTPALHSSGLELGKGHNLPLGNPVGFLLTINGRRLYHAGDTALFSDMRLLARGGLDVAFLPIGDWYTMGLEDALTALEFLCPTVAVPMHYSTFSKIEADPEAFARRAGEAGHRVKVLQPGESFVL